MSQAEKASEKQKSRNLHQVAKIWPSEQKLTSPRTRLILLIATRLPFLSMAQRQAQEIPTCRVSPSTPVLFTHPTGAFRLQIHLLKEPCEKARSIRRGEKNPPSYKSATWSCCGSGGRPDFLVRFLQTRRRGARAAGESEGRGLRAALGPGRGRRLRDPAGRGRSGSRGPSFP